MAKKQATYGKYTVIVNDDNSVTVKNNGKECEVAKDALREISASAKFKIDADWNTRQLGSKLVDFLNENKPAAKPVAPKAEPKSENKNEISVHGRKKMSTLQKEFSEKFEYLTLCFIIDADREKACSVKGIDTSKSIAETRKKPSQEELSIHGRTMVKTIEKYFWEELGIACQIGICNYSGHKHYFPLGDFNNKTLTQANEWAKERGCTKVTTKEIAEISQGIIF